MKKFISFLFILFLLTGCTVVRIDTTNFDTIVNVVLSKNNSLYNEVGKGYKYYIPRGVSYIDTDEYNDTLYCNGTYYYLYADVISYYYGIKIEYEENEDAYYSRIIKTDDGFSYDGYVEIFKEQDDLYFVKFVYNYAKFEALVSEDDLENTVLNASYILSTIKYNNDVISLMLNEDYFSNKEEKYEEFNTNDVTTNKFQIETNIESEK